MNKAWIKRTVCLFLTVLTVCGTAACGSAADENSSDGEQERITDFTYTEENGVLTLTGYTGSAAVLAIPSEIGGKTVAAIGNGCFQGSAALVKVTVPEGVTAVGDYAFESCSRLEKIYLPDSLNSIGAGAFSGCGKLYLADMQDNIETIGDGAFLFCGSLTYLRLPEKLRSLGAFAFSNCSAVSDVVFRGSNITSLPDRAFYQCESLKHAVFPESITAIGKRTFAGCSSIMSFYFPGTIESVGEYAFADCTGLASMPVSGDFVPENAYEGTPAFLDPERQDADDSDREPAVEPDVPEAAAAAAEPEKPARIGSIAGEKSLFNADEYKDFRIIGNDEFRDWSEHYIAFCETEGVPVNRDEMVYIMLYKGEVVPHYIAMTAVQNHDPDMWKDAENIFGDDFEDTYRMMDHGLFTELKRGKMPDSLVLYSGVYDSQLQAAAGSETTPTLEQLAAAVGNTFTDPIMISTTTDIHVACNFSDTLFIIYASKENMDRLGAVSIDSILFTNEKEILMCGGAQYRILDVGTMEIPSEDDEGNPASIYRNYVTVELQ